MTLADTVASFDARSATYDDSHMHQVVARAAADAAQPQDGMTLLDLAGGTGLVARAALPRLGRAVVLDASPGMLRRAHEAEPRLHLVRADAHLVPLRADAVDRVTCVTALHLLDPTTALQEAVRVCRPGGRVVFTTWAAGGWSTSRHLRAAAARHGIEVPDRHARTGTPDAARHLAVAAGLSRLDVETVRTSERIVEQGVWERLTAQHPQADVPQVRADFEAVLADDPVVEHVLLLVSGVVQTSSPSR